MDLSAQTRVIGDLLEAIARRLPEYLADPADWKICQGNPAVCLIDEAGNVHGRMFGTDKVQGRRFFNGAWKKASQVWITGIATGEYEKRVYGGQIDPDTFGIALPDLIGWLGGQPIALDSETWIAAGFSGIRGDRDLEIVRKSADEVLGK